MEIRTVTLKNFKIHADSHYEFRPGTNAICGENGAGKTSILEGIAWALFDHSDYTRGELIRTGAKSAQVAVAFISHLDERLYEVRRCTHRNYSLHDPQLNISLGLTKLEDVQVWLREHLGVPPQTNLARLFAETIGIPQGTFTTDFLRRPTERKKIFDPILKVEAYKQTYDQLRDLETHARGEVASLFQQLDYYEQQLADWPALQQQQQALTAEIAQDETNLTYLTQEVTSRQTMVAELAAKAQSIETLATQVHRLDLQVASQTAMLERLDLTWQSAKAAADLCRAKRDTFNTYKAAQEQLQQLATQRRQQQDVYRQRDTLTQQLRSREAEMLQLQGQLSTVTELRQSLVHWQQLVPQQTQLEQQLQPVVQTLQASPAVQQQQQNLQKQYGQRQAQLERLQADLTTLAEGATQAQQIPVLEQERTQLQGQLNRLQAGQAFAVDLQALITQAQEPYERQQRQVSSAQRLLQTVLRQHPDLAVVQQALASGLALNAKLLRTLQDQLEALSDSVAMDALTKRIQQVTHTLQKAHTFQQQQTILQLKQQQAHDIQQELAQIQQQQDACTQQLAQIPALQAEVAQLEAQLQHLQDPRGHLRLLQQQLQAAAATENKLAQLQTSLTPLQETITQFNDQVAAFADLEAQIEAQQLLLQTHDADYQQYLRHREQANTFRELDPQRKTTQAELATLQSEAENASAALQEAQQTFDPQMLAEQNVALSQLQQRQHQLQGGLQPKCTQLQDLDQRLENRQKIANQRTQDQQLVVRKQQILQFIADARVIYNQSGPRIAQYYQAEVSFIADQLFRELLNRDEVTLEWTEDYDIRVKERGDWRSFRSLSGGEQMCAALAVRLALLRALADINVAFFDEPTTNMDQQRRQQLAMAISNLKAFRQLIVISHDDTFETITEHVIRLERHLS
jgi:DNA repair protein SbcC/Rad50